MEKVKQSRKGSKTYSYWMASWREGNKARNVYRERQEDGMQKAADKRPGRWGESSGKSSNRCINKNYSLGMIMGNDIIDRMRAEETLRESELRLRTIFDTSSAGIIIVDTEGRITQANHRLTELFACPLESMIGTPYPAFIHPDERREGANIMQAMMENTTDTIYTERHYLRRDGSNFWG